MSELSCRRSVRERDDVTIQQYNNTIRSNVRIVLPTVRTSNIEHLTLQEQSWRTTNNWRQHQQRLFRSPSRRNSIVNRLELSNLPQEHS